MLLLASMAALFDFTAPSPAANGASYSKGMKTEQEKKSTDLVPTDFHAPREDFQIPVPGQDGAVIYPATDRGGGEGHAR